jgi:hypothetical protein
LHHRADSTGILAIRPAGRLGVARIMWADTAATIVMIQTFGYGRAVVPPDRGLGFVLSTDQPATLVAGESRLSTDALKSADGAYRIRQTAPGVDAWIWVQWLPDTAMVEAGCQYRSGLFRLRPAISEVASSDEGCDV